MSNVINVNFNPTPDFEHHETQGSRNGDWIVFRCAQCQDYERRLNWRTGETTVRNSSANIDHHGKYYPRDIIAAFENVN